MRAIFLAPIIILSIGSVGSGLAQTYPSKLIRIVPTVAGGTTALLARLLADHICEIGSAGRGRNRPGTSGTLGMDAVVKALPDGYTLGFYNMGLLVTPFMRKSTPFDPIKDQVLIGERPSLNDTAIAEIFQSRTWQLAKDNKQAELPTCTSANSRSVHRSPAQIVASCDCPFRRRKNSSASLRVRPRNMVCWATSTAQNTRLRPTPTG